MKKKLTEMTVKEIEKEIELNKEKREELFKKKAPIDRNLVRLARRNEKLDDQIATIRATSKKTDWEWLLQEDQSGGMEKYHLRQKKLRELGLDSQGVFPTTRQVQVRVALTKNDKASLSKTLKGLKKILKYIKPVKGMKRIDIFEASLSEHGVWELVINEKETKYNIQVTRWHRTEVRHKFNNLKEALQTIQNSYYYEDKNRSECECNDFGDGYGDDFDGYNY